VLTKTPMARPVLSAIAAAARTPFEEAPQPSAAARAQQAPAQRTRLRPQDLPLELAVDYYDGEL
jgi:hypothetical protein